MRLKFKFKIGKSLNLALAMALLLGTTLLSQAHGADPGKVRIFAAASTTNAITDISNLFTEKKMGETLISFASSSTLAKQIDKGAPADVYLSANPKWMDFLEEKNQIEPGTRFNILGNKIVLIAPIDSDIKITIAPGVGLAGIIGEDKLAVGDPDHVPVGIYAKQALESLGEWTALAPKLARTKDVRSALALVERGEAPLGIVYSTDAAISQKVRVVAVFPEETHPPITYPVGLVAGNATPAAKAYIEFLKTPEARAIFEQYGFSLR